MWGLFTVGAAFAQTTAFTYQGKLTDSGSPANGNYDLTFKLFDTATVGSGTQQGATLGLTNVAVSAGVFTVQLDFGACASCFNGAARYLDIAVKPTSGSTFTQLAPRQPVTANPYAIKSLSAATADGLSMMCVSCITSSQIASVNGSAVTGTLAGSQISGAIPVASVPAGSSSYIQNTTTTQATANFNISGDGTAGGTLSGNTVNAATQYNLGGARVLGVSGAGSFVNSNTFVGNGAGAATIPDNTGAGNKNAFFGQSAGLSNTTGVNNAFFGQSAGMSSTTGFGNVFLGYSAGSHNVTGSGNIFIGQFSDFTTTNPTGSSNTLLGTSTKVPSGLINATAIGQRAMVTQSDSLVLGSIQGVNAASTNTKIGIGTTAPSYRLHVEESGNLGLRVGTSTAGGRVASFGPFGNFEIDAPNIPGGRFLVNESGLVNIGNGRLVVTETGDLNIGNGRFVANQFGNVGINRASPVATLDVNGNIRFNSLGAAGGTALCLNSSSYISFCSSSRRYKDNIADWRSGLDLISHLRPVTFDWKESHAHDLGLVAEEVAEVEPLLVIHNDKGEIEGVKYDRLGVVLVNAVREQQTQIAALQKENSEMKARLVALERLMSQSPRHPSENANQQKGNEKPQP
jgi:hypothetical protein